jgi:hypothetical protein
MYAPLKDFTRQLDDGGMEAKTRGHQIVIGANGSILIRNRRDGKIEFEQPGQGTAS